MNDSKILSTVKLMLDISSPDLEVCRAEGHEASAFKDIEENPYPKNTLGHAHWNEGWWEGLYANSTAVDNNDVYYAYAENDNHFDSQVELVEQYSINS